MALLSLAVTASAALKPLESDVRPAGNKAVAAYKTTPQGELKINLYFPPDWKASDRRPIIILFFGGGFVSGSPAQFTTKAEYFATRGLVAASAEYRIGNLHRTPPERCAEDAKSAIRWLRMNARHLGIDTGRVIAGGGSAGGTIAAFAAYNTTFEPDGEEMSVSSKPDALVLYNPALGFPDKSGTQTEEKQRGALGAFIANWRISKGGPPAVLFFGTEDMLLEKARDFARQLVDAGIRAELYTASGQKHGFFNDREGSPWHALVLRQTDLFLASLGYLKGKPTIPVSPSPAAALEKAR
jgi:acetyl esterase